MPVILLHLASAALYLGLAFHFWQRRWRGPVLTQPQPRLQRGERLFLLFALLVHGSTLVIELTQGGQLNFGFGLAISLMWWLALALYWIESLYARMEGLQMLGLPLAAVGVLAPLIFPATHLLSNTGSPWFRAHFMLAMLSYSLFTLAALHALLMMAAERSLHRGRLPRLLAQLPPLLTMEQLLFRLIHIAFALLSLALLTGGLFAEALFDKALPINHKTVFAIISWLIFAALLIGRYLRGWRGQLALRWTLAGFASLLLAYFGSRFVIEVLLGRVA